MPSPVRPHTTQTRPLGEYRGASSRSLDLSSDAHGEPPMFDVDELRLLSGLPLRSVRRHRSRAGATFASVMTLVVLAAIFLPRHYKVETKFFAERNAVMPALGNPRRAVPRESDAPTRLAAEAVLKRENLNEVIRETNLLKTWSQVRSPIGKARDFVVRVVHGPMSDSDRMGALIGLLEKRMRVESNEGTVTIGVDWVDPTTAYRIVQSAQQNFFEQRHASEVAMIGESIGILEAHVSSAEQRIQEALLQLRQSTPAAASRVPSVPRPAPARVVLVPPEVSALQADLASKQQTIADLESSRTQRVAQLQFHLAELRNSYGAAHPEIETVQENIRALSTDSPQLVGLKTAERSLRSQLAAFGNVAATPAPAPAMEPGVARAALDRLMRSRADSQDDPPTAYAKSRLKIATNDYEDLLDRLESAHIELESARAAFKYRFNVITPPQIPGRADKPNVPMLLIGGFLFALISAVAVAMAADLTSGVLVEGWQVSRHLKLPLLAEVRGS